MTRSDNPFGDLPEWKERQRLQEAQGHGGSHSGSYEPHHQEQGYQPAAPPHQHPHADPTVDYSQGYEQGGQQYGAPPPTSYHEAAPVPSHSQLHYNVHQDGMHQGEQQVHLDAPQVQGYHPQQVAMPETGYDPQTQVTYPAGQGGQYTPSYQDPTQVPQSYDPGNGQPGLGGPGLRESHYDDRAEIQR